MAHGRAAAFAYQDLGRQAPTASGARRVSTFGSGMAAKIRA